MAGSVEALYNRNSVQRVDFFRPFERGTEK